MLRTAAALAGILTPLLASLLWIQGAEAQEAGDGDGPRTSSLSWVRMPGAEGCISSRRLAEAVETRLRRPVFVSAAQADLSVEGRVEPADGGGFRATLVASEPSGAVLGERELGVEGPGCAGLAEPLALVIAVMIDPDAALAQHEPDEPQPDEPQPDPPQPDEPQPDAPQPEVRVVEVPVSRPWSIEIGGGLGFALGLLPGAAGGIFGSILVDPPGFWGVELESALLPGVEAAAGDRGAADLGMLFAGVLLCPLQLGNDDAEARLCAGGEIGAIRMTGPPGQEAVERVVGQLVLRARLHLSIVGPLRLWARPSFLVPLRRQPFTYRDGAGTEQTLFDPPALGASFDLGLGLRFDL